MGRCYFWSYFRNILFDVIAKVKFTSKKENYKSVNVSISVWFFNTSLLQRCQYGVTLPLFPVLQFLFSFIAFNVDSTCEFYFSINHSFSVWNSWNQLVYFIFCFSDTDYYFKLKTVHFFLLRTFFFIYCLFKTNL